MSIVNGGSTESKALVARVKGLLLKPSDEWSVIDAEPATVRGLYVGYACILAAIPAVCSLIGGQLFGYGAFGVVVRPPLVGAVVGAVISYGLSLAMTYVLALVIDALAPSFDGQRSQIQALKVSVYAATASWVAGVFSLVPPIGALAILGGLYSLFLLYRGLPKLMRAPESKALGYTVVTVIVAIILSVLVGAVTATVARIGGLAARGAGLGGSVGDAGAISGSVKLPGGGSIDLGKLQAASKQMEAAAQGGAGGAAKALQPVAPEALEAMLPAGFAGFSRGEVSSQTGGVGGLSGSSTEARYTKGDASITLQVTDLGGASSLAALGGALNVSGSRRTAMGYEKVGKVDGRMTSEEWDGQTRSGKYAVMVADRFMVEAEGAGAEMDALKGAVGSVDFGKLESLARS